MENEIEKLFEGCRSNQDTPLMGRIFDPLCRTCKNLVRPDNLVEPLQCSVFGNLPSEIYLTDRAPCEHYISDR